MCMFLNIQRKYRRGIFMDFIKRLLKVKNAVGFVIAGLLLAVIGAVVAFSGQNDGILMPVIFIILGAASIVLGILQAKKGFTESTNQYNRVDSEKAAEMRAKAPVNTETAEDFAFHFTGKLNQDHIMKDSYGNAVYEALCSGISLIKDTEYNFVDRLSGEETKKMIGHTKSNSIGNGNGISVNISSSFTVDKVSVWDVLAEMGYGFNFGLNGIVPRYTVSLWGEVVGYVESAGTGLMNPKYKDSAAGKIPAKGIYKAHCRRSDIPGFFLICFALSRTDTSLN